MILPATCTVAPSGPLLPRTGSPTMVSTPRTRTGKYAASCLLLLALAVLPACSGGPDEQPADQPETAAVSEVAAHAGDPCPGNLPRQEDAGDGLGTQDSATESPSLPLPEAAWVCRYEPVELGPGPDGDGDSYDWALTGPAIEVNARDLETLGALIGKLSPADAERSCRANLGPRWLLAYSAGDDLTGVVVDEFGCGDIRITDEPFENPPGDATQEGTVSGVLSGPGSLLQRLKLVWVEG